MDPYFMVKIKVKVKIKFYKKIIIIKKIKLI